MTDSEQLRFNDIVQGMIPPPLLWDCMKTCKHAHESPRNDHFPGTTMERCWYGADQEKDNHSHFMVEKLVDNRWICWCKYYEEATT